MNAQQAIATQTKANSTHHFVARDGCKLAFQWFAAEQPTATLICLHGSSFDSRRYLNMARVLSREGINVCLPDWRGHGQSAGELGDVDYIGQLEDDLSDLIHFIKESDELSAFSDHPVASLPLLLGGHSAGSLIALRYIVKYGCNEIDSYFCIAPPLTKSHETSKYDFKGSQWQYYLRYGRKRPYQRDVPQASVKHMPRLKLFNYFLANTFSFCQQLKVMNFPNPLPANVKSQSEDTSYSFRLVASYGIENYADAFLAVTVPCLMLVGEHDDVITHATLETIQKWYVSPYQKSECTQIAKTNHISVLVPAAKELLRWSQELANMEQSNDKHETQAANRNNDFVISVDNQSKQPIHDVNSKDSDQTKNLKTQSAIKSATLANIRQAQNKNKQMEIAE